MNFKKYDKLVIHLKDANDLDSRILAMLTWHNLCNERAKKLAKNIMRRNEIVGKILTKQVKELVHGK